MDGKSKIVSSTMLDLLKNYVNEVDQRKQQEKYLPLIEYAYNNTVHSSIGKSTIDIVEGRYKVPLLLRTHDKIFVTIDEYVHDL